MLLVLEIVFPVCLMIAVGFAASLFKIVRADASEVIGDFVFKIAIPVLLFRLAFTADLEAANPWRIWGSYFGGAAVVWLIAAIVLPLLFRREAVWGVIASVASGFANTVLIGIPIVLQAFGEEGMLALTVLLFVHLPTLLLVTTFHYEITQLIVGAADGENTARSEMIGRFVKSITTNPILIGVFSGLLANWIGLPQPKFLLDLLTQISSIAGPMALIVLGMGLRNYGLSGNILPGFVISALKLIVMPASVFVLGAYVLDLPPIFTAALVVTAACPSGVNSFLFASYFRTGQALSANSITISTVLSVVTLTGWLALMLAFLGH